MASLKSLTFTTAGGNQLRVTINTDGALLFEIPGEYGWEDSYESILDPSDAKDLIAFIGVGEQ